MKNTIKVQRAIHDMTQAELAMALNVSRQTINSIEIKKYVPSTLLALKIARHFNVAMEKLFILEEDD